MRFFGLIGLWHLPRAEPRLTAGRFHIAIAPALHWGSPVKFGR